MSVADKNSPNSQSNNFPNTRIMVAPNGARLTQQDHPAIPITPSELVKCISDAVDSGAQAVHMHVRDRQQKHVLDAGLYLDAIAAIRKSQGASFPIQITTEAVGIYSQAEQINVVREVKPEFVSVALSEMAGEESQVDEASRFYHWCQSEHVSVQHILYSADDFRRFLLLQQRGVIPENHESVLFVLGKYAVNQLSDTAMLNEFLKVFDEVNNTSQLRWMICAFGHSETACLAYAAQQGGHARVGFENNTVNEDGSIANSNAERILAVRSKINTLSDMPVQNDSIRRVLGQQE